MWACHVGQAMGETLDQPALAGHQLFGKAVRYQAGQFALSSLKLSGFGTRPGRSEAQLSFHAPRPWKSTSAMNGWCRDLLTALASAIRPLGLVGAFTISSSIISQSDLWNPTRQIQTPRPPPSGWWHSTYFP